MMEYLSSSRARALGTPWTPVLVLLAALAGCGAEGPAIRTVDVVRVWEPVVPGTPARVATSAERFRFTARPAAGGTPHYHWTAPAGWIELQPSSMRQANFQVAGHPEAECYLTVLGGTGGGLLANVNRWREQMSLAHISIEELEALPRVPFFDGEALLVDLAGTYSGMGGDVTAGDGYRMLGLLAVDAGRARFLKMVGPADVLENEVEAFLALAGSFHEDAGAHGEGGAGEVQASGAATEAGSWLAWETPAGWSEGPPRPMREVTFFLGEGRDTECYVAVLGGNGGGAFSNVNRWRDQMGVPALSSEAFATLERIGVLGAEAIVVEISGGSFEGMAGERVDQAGLLGLVCELPDRAIFVKMVGPEPVVGAAREDFLSFCRSLEPRS